MYHATMTRLDIERAELRNFATDVRVSSARSLELLRDIENTLAWLERLTSQLNADSTFAEKINAELHTIADVIDPDDTIQSTLEVSQGCVNSLYELLIEKRQHGRNDRQLTDSDGIEDAYTEAITAAADLHNAINTLRWNVGEHDIDADHHISDPSMIGATPEEIKAIFDRLLSE